MCACACVRVCGTVSVCVGWGLCKSYVTEAAVVGNWSLVDAELDGTCSCSRSSRSYTSSMALCARSMVPLAAPALRAGT